MSSEFIDELCEMFQEFVCSKFPECINDGSKIDDAIEKCNQMTIEEFKNFIGI